MEFLTQQNIVRILLTIKQFLNQTQVSAWTSLYLLGKFSAAADLVVLGRLHLRLLQRCLLSVWRPHIPSLDHQVLINNMIRFHLKWWMDTNCFIQETLIHPPDPNVFLSRMPAIISNGWDYPLMVAGWKTNPNLYQYSRNNGHLFCTEESHTIHTPLLCYDIHRQYNSCLVYQQTRRNTFPQPMRRGMGSPPLVPGTRRCTQNLPY